MKRRILVMALVLASLCSMFLSTGSVGAAEKAAPTEYVLSQNTDKLKMIGRNAVDETGVYVAWSNAGIAFTGEFQGEVKLVAEGHTSYYAYHNNGCGQDDHSGILKFYEQITGVEVRKQ